MRNPVVSGQFYPESREAILQELSSLVVLKKDRIDPIAMIAPHAGYIYSGGVAGELFGAVQPKEIYVLLGPNHTGLGKPFGISSEKYWKTPLGDAQVNSSLSLEIKKNCSYAQLDNNSHESEHSIEVLLPFLQFLGKDFSFVAVSFSGGDLSTLRRIGEAIAVSIKNLGIAEKTSIIASSDMTHYEPQRSAEKKDSSAIDAILHLDEEELWKRVHSQDISMCGYAPAITAISGAKSLGANKAKLIKYATSGDVSGDYSSVVGYASIAIS